MKINFLLLSFIFFLIFRVSGNCQTYHLDITNEPYEPIVGGTALVIGIWDDPEFEIPIGFNFYFFGMTDKLYCFADFQCGVFSSNLDPDSLNLIGVFAGDFIDRGYDADSALSPILFKTEGTVGHRVTTIEYKNAGFYSGTIIDRKSTR